MENIQISYGETNSLSGIILNLILTFLKVSYEGKYAWISYALHVEYACMQVKTHLLYGVGLSLACG